MGEEGDQDRVGEEDQHGDAHRDPRERADEGIDRHRLQCAGHQAPAPGAPVQPEAAAQREQQQRHQGDGDGAAQRRHRDRVGSVVERKPRGARPHREGHGREEDQPDAEGLPPRCRCRRHYRAAPGVTPKAARKAAPKAEALA
jgi:hypothetical protein